MEEKFSEATSMLLDKMQVWFEGLVKILPNLVVAVVVLIVGWLLSKLIYRLASRGLRRVLDHKEIADLMAIAVRLGVLAAVFFVALGLLKLDKTVTSLLAGVGILGFALSFAFKDMASNFMAGIMMAIRKPFEEGDVVETNGVFGTIQSITLREIRIRQFDGKEVIIPNQLVFEDPVINYTHTPERRVDINCGVAYGDDLNHALSVVKPACDDVPHRMPDREVEAFFTEFGDSSINFVVRIWIHNDKHTNKPFMEARSAAVIRIKAALDEAGMTIPFPIRTLDFGVVGGERLDEILPPRLYRDGDDESESGRPSPPRRAGLDAAKAL